MKDFFDDDLRVGKRGKKFRKDFHSRAERPDTPIEDKTKLNGTYYDRNGYSRSGPIHRFLESQVGRVWDEVFSEICEKTDVRSIPRPPIFDYIDLWVEKNVVIDEDGQVWGPGHRCRLGGYDIDLYVHPDTGILCKAEKTRRKYKKTLTQSPCVILDKYNHYHQIEGIWYLIGFEDHDRLLDPRRKKDILLATGDVVHHDGSLIAVSKKQANKKEIKWIEKRLSGEV